MKDLKQSSGAIGRGSVIGFFLGVLPGGGAVMASLAAYATEKRISKHPERFGRGAIEGVAAPETANNAAATSSFIPLLTLGIPANASMGMLFAALLVLGVTPGPQLVEENPELFWGVINSMYIGNLLLLLLEHPTGRRLHPDAAGAAGDPGSDHLPGHDHRRLHDQQLDVRHLRDDRASASSAT